MSTLARHIVTALLCAMVGLSVGAQRHITPVISAPDTTHRAAPAHAPDQPPTPAASGTERYITPVKPETNVVRTPDRNTDEKIIEQYLTGDTASARAQERKDSLRRVYKHYPLLTDLSVGVNIGDLLFKAFGQKHTSIDVNATLNMWNRLQPTLDVGLGWAKITPEERNFTYSGKMSPYVRIGANYNLLFKNDPAYQAYVGLRLGYSHYRYDVTDVTYTDNYWGETQSFDITGESGNALWGEFLAGLKVKLWGPIGAGWQVKYHKLWKYTHNTQSSPWFIPGFGTRGSNWAFALSVYYTFTFPTWEKN